MTSYTADQGFDCPENAIDLEKLKIIRFFVGCFFISHGIALPKRP